MLVRPTHAVYTGSLFFLHKSRKQELDRKWLAANQYHIGLCNYARRTYVSKHLIDSQVPCSAEDK